MSLSFKGVVTWSRIKKELTTWSAWNLVALILWIILIASNYFMCHNCAVYDPDQNALLIECIKNKNYTVKNFTISIGKQEISNDTDQGDWNQDKNLTLSESELVRQVSDK